MNKRPLSVTILACIYIGVGSVGFVYDLREILARHAFHYGDFLVELTEFVAIVCGAFLLRGHNWARWLALAWIAFHVGISFFDSLQKVVVHGLILLLIAYFLFRPEARTYFRRRKTRLALRQHTSAAPRHELTNGSIERAQSTSPGLHAFVKTRLR